MMRGALRVFVPVLGCPLRCRGVAASPIWRGAACTTRRLFSANSEESDVRYVEPPATAWRPGEPIPKSGDGPSQWHQLNFNEISPGRAYRCMTQSIVPRPVAFVSTTSAEAVDNIAPFSFFNGVSSKPPCAMISITRNVDGSKKDTLRNIEASGELVINIVSEDVIHQLNHCSAPYGRDESEFDPSGFSKLNSVVVRPPRCAEAMVQLECKMLTSTEIGEGDVGSAVAVFAQILVAHVRDDCYDAEKGGVRFDKLKPIARIGMADYARCTEYYTVPRAKRAARDET